MFPLETIVSRAKRRGFVYPWSDIYGWLANAWDYGPYGVQLKKNISDLWWKTFIQEREDMIWLDSQILMHPKVREASGHVAWFNDPLIDDKNTGERFRADKLIEDKINYLTTKKLADSGHIASVNKNWYEVHGQAVVSTHQLWVDMSEATELVFQELQSKYQVSNLIPESRTFDQMKAFIVNEIPNNPNTKKKAEWTDVRKFSMMFYTYQGVIHDDENKIWMRPETAQGIFVNFKNVIDTTRMRVPFGIGQIGKAFRNEITPGNFLYRTREFEQMEIEYFVENDPAKADIAFASWREASMRRRQDIMQFKADNVRFRQHESDELSHYSAGTFDVEFQYPWGWGELQGIANRTDFDLKAHQEHSKQNLQYTDPYTGVRYVPRVIEPSFGLSRTVLASLFDAYDEEKYIAWNGEEETRVVVRFPAQIAPVKIAIFPLIKKDEQQVTIAEDLWKKLAKITAVEYDDGGAIGKRYRRQDEIGTPRCITIDQTTTETGMVTLRDRDTMQQITLHTDEVVVWIKEKLGL
jgi:glycyl-tRNA synthetase